MKMKNKIIIITGGASGLGFELVKQSLAKNYYVCNIDRNEQKMKELESEYKENYKGFIGDISDEDFVKNTINEISKIGDIQILINNAGFGTFGEFTKTNLDTELEMIKTNIVGVHTLTKLFLKDMVEKDKGYILSSVEMGYIQIN